MFSETSEFEEKIKQGALEKTAELQGAYNHWTEAFSNHSLQAAYALIAANWAVHGGPGASILNVQWAKWSLAVVFFFLGFNLIVSWCLGRMLDKRCKYAEANTTRWESEYKSQLKRTEYDSWPYTSLIEGIGIFQRYIKLFAPLVAAVFFGLSLFTGTAEPLSPP